MHKHDVQIMVRIKNDKDDGIVEDAGIVGPPREQRSDEELKDIALKIFKNEIFTSLQVHEGDSNLLGSIFMPVLLGDEPLEIYIKRNNFYAVFAYMSNCMPRFVNGYPMFSACSFLTKEETRIVMEKYEKIKEALSGI